MHIRGGTMRSDSEIKRDVEDELRWDPDIDPTDIAVAVKSGVVTLTGFVRSYAHKFAAERASNRSRWKSSRRSRKHSGAAPWSMLTVSRLRRMAATSSSEALCDPGRSAKRPNALPGWHQGSPEWITELR